MKRLKYLLAVAIIFINGIGTINAQYYEMANQLPNLISPILSGSMNYKGFVELSGAVGLGQNKASFIGISTSQGFQYSSWFFMGVGMGVDLTLGQNSDYWNNSDVNSPDWVSRSSSTTRVMLPIFSDFRFNIGSGSNSPSFYIDLKVGASWLLGNSYLELYNARLSTAAQFYFKPGIGIRIPMNSQNSRQALNLGVTYQMLYSGNNYSYWNDSLTLNAIGASICYEW